MTRDQKDALHQDALILLFAIFALLNGVLALHFKAKSDAAVASITKHIEVPNAR